jgi:hypothetical protein
MIELESIGPVEDRVIVEIWQRLWDGKAQYGPLELNDGRVWVDEALEEGLDQVIYLTIDRLEREERAK